MAIQFSIDRINRAKAQNIRQKVANKKYGHDYNKKIENKKNKEKKDFRLIILITVISLVETALKAHTTWSITIVKGKERHLTIKKFEKELFHA